MSYRVKMLLPLIGLVLLCGYAGFAVIRTGNKAQQAQEVKQPLPSTVGDLATAKLVEIKDAAGQVVLNGNIVHKNKQDKDVEGEALLTGSGTNAEAKGKLEVEVSTNSNGLTEKELELDVRGLTPGASFSLFLDGQQVTTFVTDLHGSVDLEMKAATTK